MKAVLAVILLSILAACGGGDPDDTAPADSTTQPVDCHARPDLCH